MGAVIFSFRQNLCPWLPFKRWKLGPSMNFLGIFRCQNDHLVIRYLMGAEIFEFRLNLCCGSCLKRHFGRFCHTLFSNPHNLGLEWTVWTFSVLKMNGLPWAIRWAQKYFDFGLICACGGCSNRVTVRADFAIFWGGVTFRRFYFGMLPTKCSHYINLKNTH